MKVEETDLGNCLKKILLMFLSIKKLNFEEVECFFYSHPRQEFLKSISNWCLSPPGLLFCQENFLSMIPVFLCALKKLLAMLQVESVRHAWTAVRCALTTGTVRSARLNRTSHSSSTKADVYRNALSK